MKTAIWMISFLFSFIFMCCEKEEVEIDEYFVVVKNEYFEKIDSVKLASYELNSIEVNHISKEISINTGNYPLRFITESDLYFNANIKIQGIKEKLQIIVDENGQIKID